MCEFRYLWKIIIQQLLLFFLDLGVIANDVEILCVHPKKSLKTVLLSFLLFCGENHESPSKMI